MSHVTKFFSGFWPSFEQKSCSKKREAVEKMTYIRNIQIFRNPNTMITDENYKKFFFNCQFLYIRMISSKVTFIWNCLNNFSRLMLRTMRGFCIKTIVTIFGHKIMFGWYSYSGSLLIFSRFNNLELFSFIYCQKWKLRWKHLILSPSKKVKINATVQLKTLTSEDQKHCRLKKKSRSNVFIEGLECIENRNGSQLNCKIIKIRLPFIWIHFKINKINYVYYWNLVLK